MKKGFILLLFLPLFTNAQNGVYFIPSTKQADSVRKFLRGTNNDTLKMSAYYYLSSYYTELNKDSAEYYGDLQLSLAKKLNQKLWAADACFQVGYITYDLGNYPKSLNRITEGLAITDDEGSEKNNWHIKVFSGDGSPHRARLFIAASLHQIFSYLYGNAGDSPKSIAEILTAVKIAESADDKEELSLDYMSLGTYHFNKPDSVLLFENVALKYANESNYKIYIGAINTIIGNIYFAKKDYATADKYYHNSIVASLSQHNLKDEIDAFLSVAKVKRVTSKADSALFYGRKALSTSQALGAAWGKTSAYNAIYLAYKMMNNRDSAFAYIQLAKSSGDSLTNTESAKTNQYQSLNLDHQIKAREAEKARIEAADRNRIYTLLAGIAILLLTAFLLLRNSQHRKKANELLQKQNNEIERQKQTVESTLTELRSTQTQLIQSEKMASLGELTAGIAHEIQNPLNFVNNFSEVSVELLAELKEEEEKGNKEDVMAIADDLTQNLEKVRHHGKRAEAIVKGMLQHSQSGSGTKEPTNINALADEYMRLSYHGLSSKDKSFHAETTTNFDEAMPKISVIPQDIGKVFFNLFNNAFYAVNQKQKTAGTDYKPEVSVATSIKNGQVIIKVKDNGIGIPDAIKDKIMQPFFTTKPTGEGTGLGLSLTYDMVVKGHRGSITVESIEGEGAEFIVTLPC